MTKRIATMVLCLCVLMAVASCASIQRSRDTGSVRTVAGLINDGDAEALIEMTEVPFLLDQEIVVLEKDVASFWRTALAAGYQVAEPELERGVPVSGDTYREFYDSMEVRAFFNRYLKKNSRLLELKTRDGERILLLVSQGWFSRKIHGFKGPF